MLQKLKKRDSNGFTIIEVMIVLAIAGLIMLIVFLAVPALERSARNTQRKNDASNTLSSINTYIDNNGGTIPLTSGALTSAITDVKLGYYTTANVYYSPTPVSTVTFNGTSGPTVVTTEDIIYVPSATCSGGQASPPVAGTARQYALEYAVETGSSGITLQCISS